jgi:hypothetical protein
MLESTATMGWMGDHFTVVPSYVIKDESVEKSALLVYVAIRSFMGGEDMTCYPSIRSIGKRARLSETSVKQGISLLQQEGYIEVEHRFAPSGEPTSNLYRLLSRPVVGGGCSSSPPGAPRDPPGAPVVYEVDPRELEPTKDLPSPPAPVKRGRQAKHNPEEIAFAQKVAASMQELSGPWSAYASQVKVLYDLITYAKRASPDDWQGFLLTFLDKAWELRKHDKWMKGKPYTPRFLYSCAETIAEAMKVKVNLNPFEGMK